MSTLSKGAAILGAAAISAFFVGDASAELGTIHPDLARATEKARAAKGPEIYTALREIWRTWDRANPAQVEASLESISEAKSTSPAAKAYADLLLAYARRRRGDLDGSIARVKKLGFIDRFFVLGALANEDKIGLDRVDAAELELFDSIDLGRTYDGKERPVKWRTATDVAAYGYLDLGQLLRPREAICAFVTTYVRAKAGTKAPRELSVWVGAGGAYRLWWNGTETLRDPGYRDLDADRRATLVTLGAGLNRLTMKVCGAEEAPKLTVRLADAKGAPDLGVEVLADLASAQEYAKASKGAKEAQAKSAPKSAPKKPEAKRDPSSKPNGEAKKPAPKKVDEPAKKDLGASSRGGPEGPLQAFEKADAQKKIAPELLEAFARYLASTGGDAKPEHTARDLARRAAEASPTIHRLLLAGELAEDRNQTRAWVEKAKALPGGADDVGVLLALAQLARTGSNWRDAVPLYERIRTIDGDNVPATLGLVELYVEAGLPRSALATLEKAVLRQPSSVQLLRVYASQLRAVGRDTEADEVESRYASLRFDDASFLSAKVELAVARRDAPGAERWLERFLKSEPDSAYARSFSARTYRALGQKERAFAAYQRALTIAPEDIPTLRALSDLYGEEDRKDDQLRVLRTILALSPQAKDVREYVEHIEPPKPRVDETYAWPADKFLALRGAPQKGANKRTLRSLTVSTVFGNGLSTRFRQIVYQPLTDEAAAGAREYAFGFQSDRETVTLRAAKVYRADGKIDEAIESGEGSANDPSLQTYTSARVFYVHFPRLNAGDVVELRYRVEDVAPRNEISDYFGEVEYMGTDEPVANSEYVLVTPKSRTFYANAASLPNAQHERKEEGEQRFDRWFVPEVAEIVGEPSMPPASEITPHISVSTVKSWDELGALYWGIAKDQFDVDDEVRKVVKQITKGLTDNASKVKAIYRYATETRYVALELGLEGIKPRRCAQTLARGWGDCKDKATLIVSMLREIGVPATIVLVRTGYHGLIEPDPPSLAIFDHAIAYVPSMDLYLDGTAEHSGSTELPVMDRGAIALQVNEGHPKLVRLPEPPPEATKTSRKLEIAVGADGTSQFAMELSVSGANAPDWRTRYLAEGTRKDRATRDLSSFLGTVELQKGGVEVNNLDDEEQPVHLKVKGKALGFGRRDGEALDLPAGPAHRLAADYASLSKRSFDIRLGAATTREDEWTIKLPPGLRLTRSGVAAKSDTPFGAFSIAFEESAGKVVVKTSLTIKKSRVKPSEYPEFRAFCESVDRAFGQRIVVSK